MAIAAIKLDRYYLPSRIRTKNPSTDGGSCRLALADRIASLPGIRTQELGNDTLSCRVKVYLQEPTAAPLLCTIDVSGIEVYGLTEWDRHQVLRSGWGRLQRDHVLLYPPRDVEELDMCCGILKRAHQHLSKISSNAPCARKSPLRELPKFSRTTLQ